MDFICIIAFTSGIKINSILIISNPFSVSEIPILVLVFGKYSFSKNSLILLNSGMN